jgi:peptide/nickel transport system substrate-binding protein
MNEKQIRRQIERVREGRLSRRALVQRLMLAGLAAPMANLTLINAGLAQAVPRFDYKPTKRGGGGALKVLWWQGPTLLNPHFATGTKDVDGSRVFHEPLAAWDGDGNLVPILADSLPSTEDGTLAKDGMSVTWKLKKGATWHDGAPVTADDLVFNWEYARDPATAAVTIGNYRDVVAVEKIDPLSVRVKFDKPTPFWADAFVGSRGMLIPKHLFAAYAGDKSRDAPNNLKPVGTGPYKFVDFKPGDIVKGELNASYHLENRPFFDTIEMKGGGDAVSAARAVMQTGEYDYAWNVQVEDEILLRLEQGGKGRAQITRGGSIEFMQLNNTDPWTEVDGERSSIKTKHPVLSDPAVKQAIGMLVDRKSVQDHIYGRTGVATANFLNYPERFQSKSTKWEFSIEKANQVLEAAGWKKGADGVRAKDGKKLKFVFQTSINAPRQKTQAIIKQACQKAGIDLELKSVAGSVYFSSDVGNPDTYTKFYCDMQMYTTNMGQPDPGLFMQQYVSWEASSKENKWQGRNITRWSNEEYDALFRAAGTELDPAKRAAMFIKMNELVINNQVVVPVVYRPGVGAISNKLRAPFSGWDSTTWNLREWWREA